MLANLDQFQTLIDSHKPGDEIEVEYFRGGKLLDVKSKLSQKRVASVGLHHLEQYHKDLFQVAKDPHGNKINYQIHNCEACHATPARWGKPQGIALDRWINASGDNRLIGWNVDSFAKDVDKTDKADK